MVRKQRFFSRLTLQNDDFLKVIEQELFFWPFWLRAAFRTSQVDQFPVSAWRMGDAAPLDIAGAGGGAYNGAISASQTVRLALRLSWLLLNTIVGVLPQGLGDNVGIDAVVQPCLANPMAKRVPVAATGDADFKPPVDPQFGKC